MRALTLTLCLALAGCGAEHKHKPTGLGYTVAPECLKKPIEMSDCTDDTHCEKVKVEFTRACAVVHINQKVEDASAQ
jgi:hypothetical protein